MAMLNNQRVDGPCSMAMLVITRGLQWIWVTLSDVTSMRGTGGDSALAAVGGPSGASASARFARWVLGGPSVGYIPSYKWDFCRVNPLITGDITYLRFVGWSTSFACICQCPFSTALMKNSSAPKNWPRPRSVSRSQERDFLAAYIRVGLRPIGMKIYDFVPKSWDYPQLSSIFMLGFSLANHPPHCGNPKVSPWFHRPGEPSALERYALLLLALPAPLQFEGSRTPNSLGLT